MKQLFRSKSFWENVAIVAVAILLFLGLRLTIQDFAVDGQSMENTFQNGERVLVDKLAYNSVPHKEAMSSSFTPQFRVPRLSLNALSVFQASVLKLKTVLLP